MENPELTPAQKLEAMQAEFAALQSENATLKQDLKASQDLATEAEGKFVAAQGELETCKAQLETANSAVELTKAENTKLTGELEAIKTEVTTLKSAEQDIEKRASAKLIAMCAEAGIAPPLESGAPPANPSAKKPISENLKGFARVVAAFQAKQPA